MRSHDIGYNGRAYDISIIVFENSQINVEQLPTYDSHSPDLHMWWKDEEVVYSNGI